MAQGQVKLIEHMPYHQFRGYIALLARPFHQFFWNFLLTSLACCILQGIEPELSGFKRPHTSCLTITHASLGYLLTQISYI